MELSPRTATSFSFKMSIQINEVTNQPVEGETVIHGYPLDPEDTVTSFFRLKLLEAQLQGELDSTGSFTDQVEKVSQHLPTALLRFETILW
jgi:hypothetical protein